jgi:hypothetical protein
MDARELLALLVARGKLVEEGGGFTTAAGRICAHGHDHP